MRKNGFTLIELLIVILIIAILSGITTTVVRSARSSVKASLVNAQLVQLSMALDNYKNKYGEYPPDFSDIQAVMRHVRRRWPRYGLTDYVTFTDHIMAGSLLSSNGNITWNFKTVLNTALDQAVSSNAQYAVRHVSALVFWLGGLPDASGIPRGFYLNPKAPLGYLSTVTPTTANYATVCSLPAGVQREESFFEFEEDDVAVDNNGTPAFLINQLPVVYFKAVPTSKTYVNTANNKVENMGPYGNPNNILYVKYCDFPSNFSELGIAVPYARKPGASTFVEGGKTYKDAHWYEEDRFQLVYPGADGRFSPPPTGVDTPNGYTPGNRVLNAACPVTGGNIYQEDKDNVVNFADDGSTVESLYDN